MNISLVKVYSDGKAVNFLENSQIIVSFKSFKNFTPATSIGAADPVTAIYFHLYSNSPQNIFERGAQIYFGMLEKL